MDAMMAVFVEAAEAADVLSKFAEHVGVLAATLDEVVDALDTLSDMRGAATDALKIMRGAIRYYEKLEGEVETADA